MAGFDNDVLYAKGGELGPDARRTVSATRLLSIIKNQDSTTNSDVINNDTGTSASAQSKVTSNDSGGGIAAYPSTFVTSYLAKKFALIADSNCDDLMIRSQSSQSIEFYNDSTKIGEADSTGQWSFPVKPLQETSGGTGTATYTTGDILYASASNTLSKLSAGNNGDHLVLTDGVPQWNAESSPGIKNLGLFISAGTLTIKGANGNDLSASNPAYVTMQSNVSPGQLITYSLTSNFTIDDTTAGTDLDGALWGTTTSVAWGNSMPLFIYFVSKSDDTAVVPALSRVWWDPTYCNTGDMKVKGTNTPVNEEDFISMVSGITASQYEQTSTLRVGYFTATKDSSDDWTFDALTTRDGIDKFPSRRSFTMPTGQNGANSGSYLSSSVGGDTLPTFTSQGYSYSIDQAGRFTVQYGQNPVNSAGSGAGNIRVHLPYSVAFGSSRVSFGGYRILNISSGLFVTAMAVLNTDATPTEAYAELIINGNGTRKLQPNDYTTDMSNGSLDIEVRGIGGGF